MKSDKGKTRTEPFQVLALGLSRSGTESLCKALNILGYNTYHDKFRLYLLNSTSADIFLRWRTLEVNQQCRDWTEAMEAKYENKGRVWEGAADFDRVLADYTACADLPCAMFGTELIDAYPEAKVILNQRPVNDWYRSLLNSVESATPTWIGWLIFRLDREGYEVQRCWAKANGHCFRWDVRRNAKQVYKEHGAMIRGAAPAGRFLEYDPNQGWEPLCKFLNKPIPKEEFPTGNVAQEFHKRIEACMKPKVMRGARNLGLLVLSVTAISAYAYIQYSKGNIDLNIKNWRIPGFTS